MTAPYRVQLSRKRGWKMPANTVKVARPGMFGNPFRVGDLGVPDAATAVRKFKALTRWPQKKLRADGRFFMFSRESIRHYLRGQNVACFCALDAPCHGDVLLRIANA